MKKIIIGILLMIILCFSFVMAQTCNDNNDCEGTDYWCLSGTCYDCIDSDGTDYFTKGTLEQGLSGSIAGYSYVTNVEETCVNDYEVREYSCQDDSSFRYSYDKDCTDFGENYICSGGACVYESIAMAGDVEMEGILIDDEIEQSFVSLMDAFGISALDVSSIYSCKDTDGASNYSYGIPGKVACFGPILNSAVILVDGCKTEGKRVYLREYFAEDCANCDVYEIVTGKYTINIHYEDYYCGRVNDNRCLTDDHGAAYCESAQTNVGRQLGVLAQEEEDPGSRGFLQNLRQRITGGFFF